MTASPSDVTACQSPVVTHFTRLASLAALAALIGVTAPAFAQGVPTDMNKVIESPITVSPLVTDAPAAPVALQKPMLLAPTRQLAPPAPQKPLAAPHRDLVKAPEGFAVGSLGAVNADDAGPLLAHDGGLGTDMWAGTDRYLAEMLIGRVPVGSTSPTVRGLTRRLLLSAATAPKSTIDVAASQNETDDTGAVPVPGDFVGARVDRLMSMGELTAVVDLLHAIPNRDSFPKLARVEANTLLMSNDLARSCALAGQYMERADDQFWQTIFIFCQALAGQHDAAAMGAGLLREEGYNDPTFYALLDRLANGPPEQAPDVKKTEEVSEDGQADDAAIAAADDVANGGKVAALSSLRPLHFAMMRAAKMGLPAQAAWSNDLAVLRAVAVNPGLDAKIRAEAAERAEAAGILRTGVLRQIYASIEFSEADLAAPLTRAQTNPDAVSRALLYKAALAQTVPTALAEVISRSLVLAREGGRYQSGARVFSTILSDMQPSSELVWFAPTAARASLVVGDVVGADRWLNVMRRRAGSDAETNGDLADLRLLARIAGPASSRRAAGATRPDVTYASASETGAGDWDPQWVMDWVARHRDSDGFAHKAVWLGTLLETFGNAVPREFWVDALTGPSHRAGIIPQASVWNAMDLATGSERRAEGLGWVLVGLGDSSLTDVDPTYLRRALSSLNQMGLGRDARALALEVAVAAGL